MSTTQPQYAQPSPPPKKHTLRNVLLVLVLLGILVVAGCIAIIGSAVDSVDKSLKAEAKNDKPRAVQVGKPFTHDGYKVDGGWSVAKDSFNTVTIKGMRVTNVSGEDETGGGGRTAFLTFRFYKGKENLAEVTCDGKELQKGEASKMNCSSPDDFPKGFKIVRVSDIF